MSRAARLVARLAAAALSLLLAALPALSAAEEKYGKTLVSSTELSADTLAAYAAFKPSPYDPRYSPMENKLSAKTQDWASEPMPTPSNGNPYRMVVRVTGEPIADGPTQTLWALGWVRPMPNGDKRMAMAGYPALEAVGTAGKPITLVTASGPVSFKEDVQTVANLGFMGATNFRITSVQVELWSGLPGTSFKDVATTLGWLIVSALIVLSGWYFFRRQR